MLCPWRSSVVLPQPRTCISYQQLYACKGSRLLSTRCPALAGANAETSQLPQFDSPITEKKRRGRPKKSSVSETQFLQSSKGRKAGISRSEQSSAPSTAGQHSEEHGASIFKQQSITSDVSAPQQVAPSTAGTPHTTAADTTPIAGASSQHSHGEIPAEKIWRHELRHFTGIMANPNRPWVEPFILKHCYVVNTPDTRNKFISMGSAEMHKLLKGRQQFEQRLAKSAHAITAAWKRLQLLSEAVGDRGQVLSEEQLNKEREQVVQMLDFLKEGKTVLARTVTVAVDLEDQRFLDKAATYRTLLSTMTAVTESYLREYLRRIGTASKINAKFQSKWQQTPEGLREPLHVLEVRRQQQLLQLQALAPDHPTQLMADYKAAAIEFECAKDNLLSKRGPYTGQPTSTGGIFWQQQSAEGTLPLGTASTAAGVIQQQQQQESATAAAAAWQQDPRQMMARPLQQLPLLPHLGRHQQWLPQLSCGQRRRQQQQEPPLELLLQQQQQQHGVSGQADDALDTQDYRAQQLQAARLASKGLLRPEMPQTVGSQAGEPDRDAGLQAAASSAAGVAGKGRNLDGDQFISYSGKVVPPFPVLLQRAIQLEEKLIKEDERRKAKFAAGNARVRALRKEARHKEPR